MAFKDENDSYLKPGMKDENEKMHATMGGSRKPVPGRGPNRAPAQSGMTPAKPGGRPVQNKPVPGRGPNRAPMPKPGGRPGAMPAPGQRPLPKPMPKPAMQMPKASDGMTGPGKLAGKASAADLAKKIRSIRRVGKKF